MNIKINKNLPQIIDRSFTRIIRQLQTPLPLFRLANGLQEVGILYSGGADRKLADIAGDEFPLILFDQHADVGLQYVHTYVLLYKEPS